MTIDHIALAMSDSGIQAHLLGMAEKTALVVRLRERLNVNVTVNMAWDNEGAPQGIYSPNGWELIPRYVGATSCLLFLDEAKQIWAVHNGDDLLRLLKLCPPIEFYVCNQDAAYLLCSNHHDFLIGWGQAQSWLKSATAHRTQ